jgi:hypothetical protein
MGERAIPGAGEHAKPGEAVKPIVSMIFKMGGYAQTPENSVII